MALLEEAPDVLDVRVGERVVAVVPVHPHPEPAGLLRDHGAEPRDTLFTALRELREPVLLDLALGADPQLFLHLYLDPPGLRIEPVLVRLVESAQALVALGHDPARAA